MTTLNHRKFTLIEILIVIVIIATLAACSNGMKTRANIENTILRMIVLAPRGTEPQV